MDSGLVDSMQDSAEPARTITVATIEDRREIREGLAVLIDGTPGFQCVGRYRSMEEALDGFRSRPADVALVDIELPGMSGIEGIRLLRERHPGMLLLMLTVYGDDERIFDALCAGACGYLLKNTPPGRLLDGLREAVNGGAPMSPDVARRVVTLFRDIRPPAHADYDLTPHELRLLKLMVDGHSYKSAGALLHVTPHAVSFHLRHIYEKLQVHTKSEAVAKALRDRLV
jgi:DNA-binding NarL/FixJ family response regulator